MTNKDNSNNPGIIEIDIILLINTAASYLYRSKIFILLTTLICILITSFFYNSREINRSFSHNFYIKNIFTPLSSPLHENKFYSSESLNEYFMELFESNIIISKDYFNEKNSSHVLAKNLYPMQYIGLLSGIEIESNDILNVKITSKTNDDIHPLFKSMYEDSLNNTLSILYNELLLKRTDTKLLKEQLYSQLNDDVFENQLYLKLLNRYDSSLLIQEKNDKGEVLVGNRGKYDNFFIDDVLMSSTTRLFEINRDLAFLDKVIEKLENNNFKFIKYSRGAVEEIMNVTRTNILVYALFNIILTSIISILYLTYTSLNENHKKRSDN